jgi:Protein of unknown function (DUF3383)
LIGRVILEAAILTTPAVGRIFQTRKCMHRLPPFGACGALFDGVGARFCVALCVLFCAGPALAFKQEEAPTSCNRLILVEDPAVPVMDNVMTFSNATDVANRFGRISIEATLAREFWSGAPTSGPCANAKLLLSRGPIETARPHLFSGNLASLCNGSNCGLLNSCAPCAFYVTANGYPYDVSVNLSSAATASDVAEALQSAIGNAETVVGNVTGSISPQLVNMTSAVVGGSWIEVLGVSSGVIQPGGFACVSSNPCNPSSSDFVGQITAQIVDGENNPVCPSSAAQACSMGRAGAYVLYVPSGIGIYSAQSSVETYGQLAISALNSGACPNIVGLNPRGGSIFRYTFLSASISGGSCGTWAVDLAQTVSPVSINIYTPPLTARFATETGPTSSYAYIDLTTWSTNTAWPSSSESWASGPAAGSLYMNGAGAGSTTGYDGAFLGRHVSLLGSPRGICSSVKEQINEFESAGIPIDSFQLVYSYGIFQIPDFVFDARRCIERSGLSIQWIPESSHSTPPVADFMPQ